MFNANHERIFFVLPDIASHEWQRLLDTSLHVWGAPYTARTRIYRLASRSVAVFRLAETPRKTRKPTGKKAKS